ncbi:WD40-repeat-containing domain [Phytophthora cactorum]|nr:WD40-repeat-containing domain [Phytophthora cactorum]
MRSAESSRSDLLFLNFNQEASHWGIGIAEMLYCTSLVALVGAGDQVSCFSPRRLRVWNTKTGAAICDLNFVTAVLAVRMNRQRLVAVLERKIYIFDISTMKILETLDTSPNPKALCVLSPHDNGHLAFPSGASPGEIVLYDANNLSVLNAFMPTVYCLAFNESSTILCASSDTGTIHFFSLTGAESSATGSFGHFTPITSTLAVAGSTFGSTSDCLHSARISPGKPTMHPAASAARTTRTSSNSAVSNFDEVAGVMSSYLPSSFSGIAEGTRDFAYARLRSTGVPNLCAIHGPRDAINPIVQLYVATTDGYFYDTR